MSILSATRTATTLNTPNIIIPAAVIDSKPFSLAWKTPLSILPNSVQNVTEKLSPKLEKINNHEILMLIRF